MSEKEQNKAVEQEAPEVTETGSPEAQAELTVQDLTALKQIIDVASQRGAFKPNEMMTVGTTYNKLEAFLNAVASQNKKDPQGE
jgi:hypothetical protein